MASSSFCEISISLKSGQSITWAGEDGDTPFFQIPSSAKKLLVAISSVDDLITFIIKCASVYEDPAEAQIMYNDYCKEFDTLLRKVEHIEDLCSLTLAWGEFDPENGLPPKEGCEGESLEYVFDTKVCKIKRTPDKQFVREMNDIYGDMFD